MDPILDIIDQALASSGLSDAAASKMAVGNYALIKNMRTARGDDKRYSFQALEQLARVLGLECYFGPKRVFSGFSEGSEQGGLGQKEALRAGYLPIPWHSEQGAKGSAPVALHHAWLASNGLIPDNLQALQPNTSQILYADPKNTVAVIQTNAARKGNGSAWCYREAGSIGIARVAFADRLTILLPRLETEDARVISKDTNSSISLLGKVVWIGILQAI